MTTWLIAAAIVAAIAALTPIAIREIRWRRYKIPESCRNLDPADPKRPTEGEHITIDDKLSIVLPIKIRVHHEHSELERIQKLLLPSLLKFFRLEDLHQLLIITPPADAEEVRKGVEPFAEALKIRVMTDNDFVPRVDGMSSGWAKQQILKIAASNVLQTKHYLVFDTDNLMVAPAGFAELCPGGKARVTREGFDIHPRWWRMSARMLRYDMKFDKSFSGPTTTPQMLYTQNCRELQKEIEVRRGKAPWECVLARYRGWSEYTMAWLYLLTHYEWSEYYDDTTPLHRECIWGGAEELTPEFIDGLFSDHAVPFTVLQSRIPDMQISNVHALVAPHLT